MSLFYVNDDVCAAPAGGFPVNGMVIIESHYLAMITRNRLSPPSTMAFLLCSLLLVTGCASMPDPADPEAVADFMQVNDPFEPTNRTIFEVNRQLDRGLFKPVAETYRDVVPVTARTGIQNFLANLRTPIILLNDILQFDLDRTVTTVARFMVNSTVGMFGLADVAAELGVAGHEEDFGQTLAVWGVPPGPYLMLPVLGPSNPRDAVGRVVDILSDPLNGWASNAGRMEVAYGRAGSEALDRRTGSLELLNEVEKSSLDFYAAIRSLYRQKRAHEISNGVISDQAQAGSDADFPEVPEFQGEDVSRR